MYKKVVLTTFTVLALLLVGKAILSTAYLFPFLVQLVFNRDIKLKEVDNRVNILLLGIGGGTHDGPNLTDTVIFSSLDPQKSKITLVSIPRDLWVPDLKNKINKAYSEGEAKRKGGGITLAQAAVAKLLSQDINYTVRVDFAGFVKAVDIVGGLDVNVENTFDDYNYPIGGKEEDSCGKTEEEIQALATASAEKELFEAFSCRYKHIHFDKGIAHMNGETALEFVRSRHAEGAEGSDFARSKRQAKVIKAFKDKAFSLQILTNPAKIISLYNTLQNSIDTNIKQDEFDDFIRLAQKMRTAKIQNGTLDAGDTQTGRAGLLINPDISEEYNFEWVLIPRLGNGNFSEIRLYVECEIKSDNCPVVKLTND